MASLNWSNNVLEFAFWVVNLKIKFGGEPTLVERRTGIRFFAGRYMLILHRLVSASKGNAKRVGCGSYSLSGGGRRHSTPNCNHRTSGWARVSETLPSQEKEA
ncbi:hypothetical protein J6590_028861 [Homalodisca vitripennis]|nr:hypothetical protein J6590_028861 [Homalodisca vitripennis]